MPGPARFLDMRARQFGASFSAGRPEWSSGRDVNAENARGARLGLARPVGIGTRDYDAGHTIMVGIRLPSILAAAAIAIYLGTHILRPLDDWSLMVFTDGGMLLASATAAACAFVAARRRPAGRARLSWMLMALGLTSWAIGDSCWGVAELVAGETRPRRRSRTSSTSRCCRWRSPASCCGRSRCRAR